MRRLVVALTALLTMLGAAVVGGYLLFFAAGGDRMAGIVPADAAIYLKVELQPSGGQKRALLELIGHLPGFRDDATREQKIHEVAQTLLAEVAVDYAADLRPWLGGEVAMAAAPPGAAGEPPRLLLVASVKDAAIAGEAVPRLMARDGVTYRKETYRGQPVMASEGLSYALLADLLVVADSPARLRDSLDAEADAATSLADLQAFDAANRPLPGDLLGSLYVDPGLVAGLPAGERLGGLGPIALALTAAPDGLHLDGTAPFDAGSASAAARAAFALGSRTGSLAAWIPPSAAAEITLFGLQQSIADLEPRVAPGSLLVPARDLLGQIRLLAGIGLGVDVDKVLLPLFDGEAAVALTSLDPAAPRGVLLLRPGDPAIGEAALSTLRAALLAHGAAITTSHVAGTTISSAVVPQVGRLAFATTDGVIVAGLDASDVAASLEVHAGGPSLAADPRYGPTFELLESHAGNELWADLPALLDASAGILDPGSDVRDILSGIGELAMSASTVGDQLEIHAILTVR